MVAATESARLSAFNPTWATLAHSLLPPDVLLPVELSPDSPIVTVASNWLKGPGIWTARKSELSKVPFPLFPGMNPMSNIIIGENDENIIYAHLSNDTTPYGVGGTARVADLIKSTLGEVGDVSLYHLNKNTPTLLTELQELLGRDMKVREHRLSSLTQEAQQDVTGIYANGWFANMINFEPARFQDVSGLGKWEQIACDG